MSFWQIVCNHLCSKQVHRNVPKSWHRVMALHLNWVTRHAWVVISLNLIVNLSSSVVTQVQQALSLKLHYHKIAELLQQSVCFTVSKILQLKLFRAYSGYICHETFNFMMSLPTMSLGLRFCVSRKDGTGGGRWMHPKAWPRLGSSLEVTWLALGGPFFYPFWHK